MSEIQELIWYSKWRWWRRCHGTGRHQTYGATIRCDLTGDHDGDCASQADGAIIRWSTMWLGVHR